MRCMVLIFFAFLLQFETIFSSTSFDLNVNAEAAILLNPDNGAILYEKNAHLKLFPASITKIATALYTIHVYGDKLDTLITAEHDSVAWVSKEAKKRSSYTLPAHWLEPNATHIGIKKGEILSLSDLLNGMLISSGNDASNVIAQFIGGTVNNFINDLNAYLKNLGCKNTHFYNPHGLHHPEHLTTAYDMGIIAKEAMKSPIFCEIVKTVQYTRPKTNMQQPTTLIQTNRLLRKGPLYYSKAIGLKTGWTSEAKNTLVAAAEYNGRRLIAVLIKVKEREDLFKEAKKMFEAAFNQTCVQRVLLKSGPQKYILNHPAASTPIKTYLKKDVCINFYPAEEPQLHCNLHWLNISLPLKADEQVGELRIMTSDGQLIQSVPLLALNGAKESYFFWLKSFFKSEKKISENNFSKNEDQEPLLSKKTWKFIGIITAIIFLVALLLLIRRV